MSLRFLLFTLLCGSISTIHAQVVPDEASLLGRWANSDLVGSSLYANVYNEVWGIATEGREYAVIGSTAGTHFIDVTDPSSTQEIAFVAGRATGSQIIHRDYHNLGCYLYAVADEGASSLQIIDLSYLPDSVSVVYDSNETLSQAHNIFIDEARETMYCMGAFGGPDFSSALRIYDISEPSNPVYLAEYNTFGGLQVNHVHDAYIHDGLAYLNCGNDGFAIVDFTDPMAPQTLGLLTEYTFQGYNHSGWPAADGIHYYLADETHGYPMKVLDISEPDDIEVLGLIPTANNLNAANIAHNQIASCDYLYVSYYYHGLYIYDISDPADPQPALFYDTSDWPFDSNYRGAWGVYPYLPSGNVLVSDMQEGLFIIAGPGDECDERAARTLDCSALGLGAIKESSLAVELFPQPASSWLKISLPQNNTPALADLQLMDLNGRVLQTYPQQWLGQEAIQLDLPNLPTGVYLLDISSGHGRQREKIVIL